MMHGMTAMWGMMIIWGVFGLLLITLVVLAIVWLVRSLMNSRG